MRQETAIIIGAGISGLLNARVLSESFHKVMLLERSDRSQSQVGIPQERHIHTLLEQGRQIISSLFQEFSDELKSRNIPVYKWNKDVHIVTGLGISDKYDSGLIGLGISRKTLQGIIEKFILKLPNTSTLNQVVEGLIIKNDRVVGVQTNKGKLYADLIIDASGGRSQTVQWLKDWGYASPPISTVNPHMGYATRWYKIPEFVKLSIPSILVQPRYSSNLYRGAAALCVENNEVVITLLGTNKDYPPTDAKSYLQFAQSLPDPLIADWIQKLDPITPIYGFRAINQLRHFEKIDLPANLIVTGDAYCTFNPFYGQGMTVAAMEANLLKALIEDTGQRGRYLSQNFHKQQAKLVRLPWLMATIEDLRSPSVDGASRWFYHKLAHKYLDRLIITMMTDAYTATVFLKVMHFLRSPISLLHPRILWKMISKSNG